MDTNNIGFPRALKDLSKARTDLGAATKVVEEAEATLTCGVGNLTFNVGIGGRLNVCSGSEHQLVASECRRHAVKLRDFLNAMYPRELDAMVD